MQIMCHFSLSDMRCCIEAATFISFATSTQRRSSSSGSGIGGKSSALEILMLLLLLPSGPGAEDSRTDRARMTAEMFFFGMDTEKKHRKDMS